MSQYVNLHSHGVYSFLDGHSKYEAYFKRAKDIGMVGLAISEHGNIHGLLEWYEKGKEHGVKPILGQEFYQARKTRWDRDDEERSGGGNSEWEQRGPYHLGIIARNNAGYHNLLKLSSYAYTEGYYGKPRADHELIEQHSEGIIVLSGCLNGEVAQALLRGDYDTALAHAARMQDIVGKENYFIEMQDHGIEEQLRIKDDLIRIAKSIGAKIVPTCDSHYANKEDAHAHDVMICINTGARVNQTERFKFSGPEFYLKSYEEMAKLFDAEWLQNTMDINDMIEVDLKFGELYFPGYPDTPKDKTIDQHLEDLVWAGCFKKYGKDPEATVVERVKHELGVVQRMGFQEYFLVVADIVNWAKNQGYRMGPGRGSAAGSILSYCLNITTLEPLKYGLMFERFLIEGRNNPPDIDLDIDDRHREDIINYVRDKYGSDHVANICTFSRLQAKSAIRDCARVLDHAYSVGDEICKRVPQPVLGITKSIKESLEQSPEFKELYDTDEASQEVIDAAKSIEGVYRQTGIHAAGVVVSREPVVNYAPVMQKGEKTPVVLQWDDDGAEKVGLLKIDFLGLRNLSVIDKCLKNIRDRHGLDINVESLPMDDPLVYRELCKGNAIGCFQIESSGIKSLLIEMQPSNFNDIAALIALYRPGPMGSGMHKMYVNRKHGRQAIDYPHPILKEYLKDVYGILLYQENVIKTAQVLAGFSVSEADTLRSVIGKKKLDEVSKYREKFVQGCVDTNNVRPELANRIYSQIEYFAGYSFNLAHAFSYGVITYITAYLKFHYPAEYMSALLSSVVDNSNKLSRYLNECNRLGIEVKSPSILRSQKDFYVESDTTILFGLGAIEGVGDAMAEYILDNRDANGGTDLHSYLRNAHPSVLNKGTLEHLAKAGALDELVTETIEIRREDEREILAMERKHIGAYVTKHPLSGVWDHMSNKVTCEIAGLDEVSDGVQVTLGGILEVVERKQTKAGKMMYVLTLQDLTGEIEVVVFSGAAAKLPLDCFEKGDIVYIVGKHVREGDDENTQSKLIFFDYEKLDDIMLFGTEPIILHVDRQVNNGEIDKLNDIIRSKPGESHVFIETKENGHVVRLKFKKQTKPEMKFVLQELLNLKGIE